MYIKEIIDLDSKFTEWKEKADKNLQKWGYQDKHTLLLAMLEELGELSQAYLQSKHENRNPKRIFDELDDLAALILQFQLKLNLDYEEMID